MASGPLPRARCAAAMARGPLEAGVPDAVRDALAGLGGAQPTLAVVQVCSPGDPDTAGRALGTAGRLIREAWGECVVLGTSAHGVLGGSDAVELEASISVWVAALPGAAPRPFRIAAVPSAEGRWSLAGLPDLLPDDRAAVLLADPWTTPLGDVLAAFDSLDGALPVVGGLVSGAQRRGEGRLLLNEAVLDSGAVGAVLGAGAPVRAVVSQGCRPIGPPMTVTAAEGAIIDEVAGRPALLQVREIIAGLDPVDQALAVRGLQMGLARAPGAEGESAADYVVRGILGADPTRGSITVGDDVAVGSLVRLHLRDADSADADLRSVLDAVAADGEPAGALLVTCNGRGRSMFTTSGHDPALVRDRLGVTAVGGFFAGGEIGPVGGANHLHGFTAVLLVVDAVGGEREVEVRRAEDGTAEPAEDLDAELQALLDG